MTKGYYRGECGHEWAVEGERHPLSQTRCPKCGGSVCEARAGLPLDASWMTCADSPRSMGLEIEPGMLVSTPFEFGRLLEVVGATALLAVREDCCERHVTRERRACTCAPDLRDPAVYRAALEQCGRRDLSRDQRAAFGTCDPYPSEATDDDRATLARILRETAQ